jgi:hypothetical protein
MGLIDSGQLSAAGANVALATMLLAMTAGAAYCWWSLRREARGHEIHAHSDGTVHEHFRGSRHHVHPTYADRYHGRLTAWFGPAPADAAPVLDGEDAGAPVAD